MGNNTVKCEDGGIRVQLIQKQFDESDFTEKDVPTLVLMERMVQRYEWEGKEYQARLLSPCPNEVGKLHNWLMVFENDERPHWDRRCLTIDNPRNTGDYLKIRLLNTSLCAGAKLGQLFALVEALAITFRKKTIHLGDDAKFLCNGAPSTQAAFVRMLDPSKLHTNISIYGAFGFAPRQWWSRQTQLNIMKCRGFLVADLFK